MERYHTLLISDLHLGSNLCNVKALLFFLRNALYKKLIVVGDLIEDGATIPKEQIEVLNYLIENRERVIVIDGNHDPAERGVVQALLGGKVLKKYQWEIKGKKFCALHGHQFHATSIIFKIWLIDKVFGWIVSFAKKRYGLNRLVHFLHARFSWSIARKVIAYAKKRKTLKRLRKLEKFKAARKKEYVIICGHTHKALHAVAYHRGRRIDYFNCGGFLADDICSFVAVDYDGNASLHAIDHIGNITMLIEPQDF